LVIAMTLADIPTVNLAEVVRVVTSTGAYDAEVLLTFSDGSRNLAFTDDAGTVRIVRMAARTQLIHRGHTFEYEGA
jgi:hypothetical protein